MSNDETISSPMSRYLTQEIQRLREEWPVLTQVGPVMPQFSWDDLKEELLALSQTPAQELVIRGALSALLKMSRFKPPEHVLGEILMLASSVSDLTSPHSPQGDAPMP